MKDYDSIIDKMPVGLKKAVARQINFHKGAHKIIAREELLKRVQLSPGCGATEDRQMRIAIQQLRNLGFRICHREDREKDPETNRVKVNFGYYLAANDYEYSEFRAKYASYAQTIWKTLKAMDTREPVIDDDGDIEPPEEIMVQEKLFK